MDFAILAGGLGSRLVKEGVDTPKPLVEIAGRPMIGRLIDVLARCGANRIAVSANPRMAGLIPYLQGLKSGFPGLSIRPVITDSSYESLCAATEGLPGRFITMTVDAIFPTDEFRRYVGAVDEMPDGEVLMGLTRFVDDASPLWAQVGPDGIVTDYRYGGQAFPGGAIVSAGLYGLSRQVMDMVAAMDYTPTSLSDFQRTLATRTPVCVRSYEFTTAFDVDNLHDLAAANAFVAKQ